MALRKNQNSLSAAEKKRFTDAVLALKDGGRADNKYDPFVSMHEHNIAAGHFGPAFFAWHREYLSNFEQALWNIKNDQSIALPYWDWSVDNSSSSSIWGSDFMGGNGNSGLDWQVTDGPFAFNTGQWPLNIRSGSEPYPYLVRQLGESRYTRSLPTPANVQDTLQATPYDVSPWNSTSGSGFRNRSEGYIPSGSFGMHTRVHTWVGGSMTTWTSPNDPVFWLHHCFMDKLWADWQMMHQDQAKYLPDGGAAKDHNLTDHMPPWNDKTPKDVLSQWSLGYHYDTDGFLLAGEVLYPGQSIYPAGSRRYHLIYENDGVLRLYISTSPNPLWKSTDSAKPVGKCIMESRGNLVIYGPDNTTKVWESQTDGHNPGCYLVVRDDGKVSIFPGGPPSPTPTPIWSRPPPNTG
jgi:tyrosinase